mmetsp:Transcript_88008/g.244275  ORF Transcript_88008/g.244275 Transcript_88008/m.244275 type:complete len:223 (-) Transcript_88008:138-806(-)
MPAAPLFFLVAPRQVGQGNVGRAIVGRTGAGRSGGSSGIGAYDFQGRRHSFCGRGSRDCTALARAPAAPRLLLLAPCQVEQSQVGIAVVGRVCGCAARFAGLSHRRRHPRTVTGATAGVTAVGATARVAGVTTDASELLILAAPVLLCPRPAFLPVPITGIAIGLYFARAAAAFEAAAPQLLFVGPFCLPIGVPIFAVMRRIWLAQQITALLRDRHRRAQQD